MAKPTPPTFAQVETAARDQHPAFDKSRTPTAVLRRHLERRARVLLQKALAHYPDPFLTCEFEYDLPPADFENGELLPRPVLYARGTKVVYQDGSEDELHLVSRAVLASPPYWPAAAIVAGTMYLARTAGDWSRGRVAKLLYVPAVGELTGPASSFDPLPHYAEDPLVAEAALFMAGRAELPTTTFARDRDEAIKCFLVTMSNQRRATKGKRRRRF